MARQWRVRKPGRGKPFASRGDSSVPSGRMETNNPVANRIVSSRLELSRQPRFAGRGKIGSSSILGMRKINCYENPGKGLRQEGDRPRPPRAAWGRNGSRGVYLRGRGKGTSVTGEGKRDVSHWGGEKGRHSIALP